MPGLMILGSLFLLGACAGSGSSTGDRSKDKLIDALTLFVEAVQEEQFEKAFSYLTPEEKRKMLMEGNPDLAQTKRRLKALRLSTLANKPGVRLDNGKLEGIFDQLPMIGDFPQTNRDPPQEAPLLQ